MNAAKEAELRAYAALQRRVRELAASWQRQSAFPCPEPPPKLCPNGVHSCHDCCASQILALLAPEGAQYGGTLTDALKVNSNSINTTKIEPPRERVKLWHIDRWQHSQEDYQHQEDTLNALSNWALEVAPDKFEKGGEK